MSNAALIAAAARELERGLLTDTCQLKAPVEGTDATVGTAKSWPAVTQTVACLVSGAGSAIAGADFDDASLPNTRSIVLPRSTTVRESWRIVPTTGRWLGRTFDVLKVAEASSYGSATTCQCAEVQP